MKSRAVENQPGSHDPQKVGTARCAVRAASSGAAPRTRSFKHPVHEKPRGTPKLLLIGCGNTLRRDDGVGVETAETIARLNLPGVNVIARHQLVPELAAPISEADAVVFVDADASGRTKTRLSPLKPAAAGRILAHAADPDSLLALSEQLFGRCPKAWILAIPVEDLGFGFGLSPRSERRLRAAVELIRELAARLVRGTEMPRRCPAGETVCRKRRLLR